MSGERIAVIGGTGVLGRNVVARLVERGHQVRATARGGKGNAWALGLGAEYMQCDLLDIDSIERAITAYSVVLNLATAVPRLVRGRIGR